MAKSALRDISPTWFRDIKPPAPQKPAGQSIADVLGGVALATAPIPVVGDFAGLASDAAMYAAYPEERTMLNAGMSLAGLLPFVPAANTIRAGKNAINIGKDVKNMGSIPASLENYEIVKGVQTLPINAFESTNMYDLFYAKNDMDRVRSLAGQIQANNRIDPLIVVQDREGYYVLEGAHRLGALDAIGAEEVPAIIVKDLDDPYVPQAGLPFVPGSAAVRTAGDVAEAARSADTVTTTKGVLDLTRPSLIDDAEREAWRAANKGSFKQYQTPALQQSAEDLLAGKITSEQHHQNVMNMRPIQPIQEVPEITDFYDMAAALNKDKVEKGIVGLNRQIPEGEMVGSRLDIPAYNDFNTWVVSLHEGSGVSGKSLGYGKTAVLDNVVFNSNPKAAIGVATGKKAKAPFARMNGNWRNVDPEQARAMAQQYMTDPEWTQVGMNPYRHSFFYDKATGDPVESAERIVQIGPLVLAKNVKKAPLESVQHLIETPAGSRFFGIGAAGVLGGDGESAATGR